MLSLNKSIFLTILFNFLIPIGAGHGIGVLGLIQIFGLAEAFQNDASFSLIGSYEHRLSSAALLATAGQIILVIAIFLAQTGRKSTLIYSGLVITLGAYFVLTNNFFTSSVDRFSFWGGLPFCICAVLLFVNTVMSQKRTRT